MQLGKLNVFEHEMVRLKVHVCGIAEVRWKGQGHFTTAEGHTVIYSDEEQQGHRGVAVWLEKKTACSVLGYEPVNGRIVKVRLHAKPANITLIQVYAPTSAATDEESNEFYEDLDNTLKTVPKHDVIVQMGDFNAKVGKPMQGQVVGEFGLGERNEAGERLVEMCEE